MDVDTQQPTSRKNRARERHERRKARQQGFSLADAARSLPRQVKPAGGFKLPELRLPQLKLIAYSVAAIAIILAVIYALGRFSGGNDEPVSRNAIWVGTEWTYNTPASDDLTALVNRLQDNQIGTVYAWVSLLQPNGTWSETIKLDKVRDFARQFRQAYPDAQLYGWLSVAAQGEDGNNRLGDATLQQQVADFSRRVTDDFGFDGVFLNVVPVLNGDENFLALLRKVRLAIGEDTPLSVAVPPDWTPPDESVPQPPQIAPNTVWEPDYKKRVAILASQMVITAYNSGLTSTEDYQAWVAYQVKAFADVTAEMATNTEVLIGIPSYDTESPEHRLDVENIAAAASGVRDGLQQAGDSAAVVTGVALYAEWDTDESDWQQFRREWLRR
ncbi:MAG: hypothetical protein HZC41_25210 [Chloroflexi bacterium]|nr:hypothetical protein [Chloroflexota bacterium]